VLVETLVREGRAHAAVTLAEFRICPEARDQVARLKGAGLRPIVFTNQPEVARGTLSPGVLDRMHGRLALHRPVEERPEPLELSPSPFLVAGFELRHHLAREELQRLADVTVAVAAALLDEDDLIDSRLRELPKVFAQLGRIAQTTIAKFRHHRPRGFVALPDVGPSRPVCAKEVVVSNAITEELKAVASSASRFL
jgi:hypothetical protein